MLQLLALYQQSDVCQCYYKVTSFIIQIQTIRKISNMNMKGKYWSFLLLMSIGMTMPCQFYLRHPHLVKKLKESHKEFAFEIYNNVIIARNDNVIISTLEITGVVGTVTLAARGNSATQMKDIFKILKVDGEIGINDAISDVFDSLCIPTPFPAPVQSPSQPIPFPTMPSYNNLTFYVFNGIFVQNSPIISIRSTYASITSHYYNTTIIKLDITNDINKTERTINNFIQAATHEKLTPFNLTSKAAEPELLFASAIYFHAKWEEGFDFKYTRPWQFHTSPTETILVNMMGKESEIAYTNRLDLRCRMIQLNYYKQRLAMYVILPYEINGIHHIENRVTPIKFHSMVASLRPTNVVLRLPKFKLQLKTELSQIMKTMGYTDIFNREKADLRGMFLRANRVAVTEIITVAAVEISEEGSKMIKAHMNNRTNYPVEFTVDHPFIFIVKDQLSGLILFMGRVMRPSHIKFD